MPDSTHRARRSAGGRTVPTLLACLLLAVPAGAQGQARLLAWNDLGMHCMDSDTSVFCILPPFNTFHAQLVVNGRLVTNGSYAVTYEGVADPSGSVNTTSIGKSDFWQHVQPLFGVALAPDVGLAGFRMPGAANTPQNMPFHVGLADYVAEGVPITPWDDQLRMRPYPLMKLVARNAQGQQVASTTPVLPVSAEMACTMCHGSGSNPEARPAAGWANGPPATDDRLNILLLHDERHGGTTLYAQSLQAAGYAAAGLHHTATVQGTPVLCAKCHGSNALPGTGQTGISMLTSAMHGRHASARLPDGRRLDDVTDRTSCYTCHPGAATRCLRGAMGKAIGADGEAMMACQDCHGSLSEVGDPARTGWLQQPNCQNCHTGDAVANAGAIRFATAFDAAGHLRNTTNPRFATTPDVPQPGYSLYRFSSGHGGMECSACHGSPHAIWPTSADNDNLQSIQAQGHLGTIVECGTCHPSLGENQYLGPHGMHPTGNGWVDHHGDVAEHQGTASCRPCHGTDSRGTVLSRAHGNRSVNSRYGARTFWRGYQIGCYECHDGPDSDHPTTNTPPAVQSLAVATPTDVPLTLSLTAADPNPDPLSLRIVEQPGHGAVAFDGATAVYRAWDGYVGNDAFTYAAGDTRSNSNLGTVTIAVGAPACAGSSEQSGFGCARADGSVPAIRLDGCPTAGRHVDVVVTGGPATGFGMFALGAVPAAIELTRDGCALRMGLVFGTTSVLGLVNGSMRLAVDLPAAMSPWDGVLQGFCLDAGSPRGFVATPGLEVRFR
jgi:hypothetical protein